MYVDGVCHGLPFLILPVVGLYIVEGERVFYRPVVCRLQFAGKVGRELYGRRLFPDKGQDDARFLETYNIFRSHVGQKVGSVQSVERGIVELGGKADVFQTCHFAYCKTDGCFRRKGFINVQCLVGKSFLRQFGGGQPFQGDSFVKGHCFHFHLFKGYCHAGFHGIQGKVEFQVLSGCDVCKAVFPCKFVGNLFACSQQRGVESNPDGRACREVDAGIASLFDACRLFACRHRDAIGLESIGKQPSRCLVIHYRQ